MATMIVGGRDESKKITEEVGDGDNLVTFVGTDDTGFTTRVGGGGDGGYIREACSDERLNDGGSTGATTESDDFYLRV